MPVWPVYVEGWQHECCGEPFGIGDRVRWALAVIGDGEGDWGWPEDVLVELRVVGRRLAAAEDGRPLEIASTADGPEVALDPSARRGSEIVRGTLMEEHHGRVPASLRPIEGVVRAVKVISQRYRRSGRTLTPAPGAVRFRAIDRMPDGLAGPSPDERAREQWLEPGAVVQLEVGVRSANAL